MKTFCWRDLIEIVYKGKFPDRNSHVCQQPIIVSKQLWWKSNINNHFCLLLVKKFFFFFSLSPRFFKVFSSGMMQCYYLIDTITYTMGVTSLWLQALNQALSNIMTHLTLEQNWIQRYRKENLFIHEWACFFFTVYLQEKLFKAKVYQASFFPPPASM